MPQVPRPAGGVRSVLTAATLAALAFGASCSTARADATHPGHGGPAATLPADVDRCDLGFNSQAYNDAIKAGKATHLTPTWSQQFRGKAPGYDQLSFADKVTFNALSFFTNDAYKGMQATGHDGHPLTDPWQGMTDPVQCDQLKSQLRDVLAAVRKYPTLGAAQRAGYGLDTPYFAGSGVHMVLKGVDDDPGYQPDTKVPPSLLYDGMGKNAAVVGAMFGYETDRPMTTDIFSGDNGTWHQHRGLCYSKGLAKLFPNSTKFVIGSEATTESACKKRGGYKDEASSLYMMHVWTVPGCENPFGLFAHDNPRLTSMLSVRSGRRGNQGCGSGTPVTAPVAFETDELNVPGKLTTYRSSQLSWAEGGVVVASGPVAAAVADHPGAAHADGSAHLSGTLATEGGFAGPAGAWSVSILRTAGVIHGAVTTPNGTVASFTEGAAARTDAGVHLMASATTPAGAAIQLSLEFADPGLRSWFLAPQVVAQEMLAIHHPAHGHDHAAGGVTYALAAHPGQAHGAGEEHLSGTATTQDGFTGTAGAWGISFLKNTLTHAITGSIKSPDATKTFTFSVSEHHDATECAGGVHVAATGSELATPADPQNPELVICDPAVTAFFADHDHSGTAPAPTTPQATTPAPTTPGHVH